MRPQFRVMAVTLIATGCAHLWANSASNDWNDTLTAAQRAASRGAYADAERLLGAYQNQHAKTREAREAAFWRAVYRSDPANSAASTKDALAALDAYLAMPGATHLAEATVLRRLVVVGDSLTRAAETARGKTVVVTEPGKAPPAPTDDAAEVKRLRDELAKANAELERIKKRLTAPKP